MGNYLKPTPPHSGLTALLGGDSKTGQHYHLDRAEHDYLVGVYSGTTTITGSSIFSGTVDVSTLFSKLPNGNSNDFLYHNGTDWAAKDFQLRAEGTDGFILDGYVALNSVFPEVVTLGIGSGSGFIGGDSHYVEASSLFNSWIIGGYVSRFIGDVFNSTIIGSYGSTMENTQRSTMINSDGFAMTNTLLSVSVAGSGYMTDTHRSILMAGFGANITGTRNSILAGGVYSNVFSAANSTLLSTYRSGISGTTVDYDATDPNSRPISDVMHSVLLGGQYNVMNSSFAGIIGGSGNTLTQPAVGSVVAAGLGITGAEPYTLYANRIKATQSIYAPTLSATTFYSGATNLNELLAGGSGLSTFVQPGSNINTGGTPSTPIINLNDIINVDEVIVGDLTVENFTTFNSSVVLQNNTYVGPGTIIFSGASAALQMTSVQKYQVLHAIENIGLDYQRIVGNPNFVYMPDDDLLSAGYMSAVTLHFDEELKDFNETHMDGGFYWKNGSIVEPATFAYFSNFANAFVVLGGISATTIYSAGTDLSHLLSPPTYVQPGTNISTGGTSNAPIVNVVGSPVFTTVTATAISGTSVSATTYYSGNTPLNTILSNFGSGSSTYVQPGSNITTGGTPNAPVVSVNGSPIFTAVTASAISGTSISGGSVFGVAVSATTFSSGNTELSIALANKFNSMYAPITIQNQWVQQGNNITTGGTPNAPSVNLVASPSVLHLLSSGVTYAQTLSGNTIYSGGNELGGLLAQAYAPISVVPTYVQPGSNVTTGGTITRPIVSVSGSPIFTAVTAASVSGTSVSATTFYSGTTPLNTILGNIPVTYVQPGLNISTGGTANRPFISVSGSPTFTAVTANNFFSGGTSFNDMLSAFTTDPSRTYRKLITQVSHGFSVGHAVKVASDDAYEIAVGINVDKAEVVGMVTKVISDSVFELTSEGYVDFSHETTILPSLTANRKYYLDKTSGSYVQGAPSNGAVIKPVFIAISSNALYVLNGTLTTTAQVNQIIEGADIRTTIGLATTDNVQFASLTAVTVSATTYYSGSTPLNTILSSLGSGSSTYVQPGSNITTGGTPTAPIINVSGSPIFTSVTANNFISGGTDLQDVFVPSTVTGVTSINFGFANGLEGDYATRTVVDTGVTRHSTIMFKVIASTDHPDIEDSVLDGVTFRESEVTHRTSFLLNAYAEAGTWGSYDVMYKIIN